MSKTTQSIQLGDAAITLINIGDLEFDLAGSFELSAAEQPARYAAYFKQPQHVPVYCVYIKLPDTSILVDAGVYDAESMARFVIPNYQPPPGLLEQLAAIGVEPAQLEHVIITHIHLDHYNGVTFERNGVYEPTFPNARIYLGRGDWEQAEQTGAFRQPNSPESQTFGVLRQRGMLELVDSSRDLGHGVSIIAAPGETPGHQIVRVHSQGQTFYCLGDLYHHIVEVEQPHWAVTWSDAEAIRASREAFTQTALAENALLTATHISTMGRLRQSSSGELTWARV